ncbi:hypothetical protein CSUI_008447 [Cystoisospora suis]|uniref:Uncharacterized protein n=1 Tax=Cystoisospora suis TaxID=483139 RepID=A0A2C6KMP5_9APIC|nr:hypothetical protein CSUI_008447 [Cystoisospora suis]
MVGENSAFLKSPPSFLTHPVFQLSLLSLAEEEPPHLRRYPVVQKPLRRGSTLLGQF